MTAAIDLGFLNSDRNRKQGFVNRVFDSVADRYDQMNDLLSGGLHRLWKDDMVTWLAPPKNGRGFPVLDVAGGTGDIAFRIAVAGSGCQVTVCDISAAMLRAGSERAARAGLAARCRFCQGDAQALPFADAGFSAYTVAFGMRNMPDLAGALREAYRVLKPGGRFLCLEFSQPDVPGWRAIYDAYSFTAIPAMGEVVTGDGAAYRYLVESIRAFPDPQRFSALIAGAGFARVSHRCLSGGIVALHSAWRL